MAIHKSDVSRKAIDVWMYLARRADNQAGTCFPALGTIARETKYCKRTVQRAVAELVKAGYLTKINRHRPNGGQSSNLFTLTEPE